MNSTNSNPSIGMTTTVYRAIKDAAVVAGLQDTIISFKRNKTTNNPEAFERAIVLPTSYFVPHEIEHHNLIEVIKTARIASATQILKKFCESTTYDSEVSLAIFQPENLDKNFISENESNSDWLTKEELQQLWNQSATRALFIGRDIYKTNKTYIETVNNFERIVLSLAGKATKISEDWQNLILAKLHADDIDSQLGKFLTFRISKMQQQLPEIDATLL